ncbi:hypothetical protein D1631_13575 [Chryseobacterium nematophagum]|uniref:Uncharacterized protein n=1 Tax=Chryseobacterium nematophagum TaxID=2305228 RepID=A0A3M7TJQ9_9FLAO|nr:hypothetical protein [Chryseobacterium nematophagum]RNA62889.1 hypothetical protein D1631_13575 [Chryseobacterium nematophagum]
MESNVKKFRKLIFFCILIGTFLGNFKINGQEWILKYNLTEREYQNLFNQLSKTHYPQSISVVNLKGENRFACLWYIQSKKFARWEARHNIKPEDMGTFQTQFVKDNMIPTNIVGYLNPDRKLRFAGVWKSDDVYRANVQYWIRQDENLLTSVEDYLKKEESLQNNLPYSLATYEDEDGTFKYSINTQNVGVKNEYGISAFQDEKMFKELLKTCININYYPVDLSIINDKGENFYSGVWMYYPSGREWGVTLHTGLEKLDKLIASNTEKGFTPSLIRGYINDGNLDYMILWNKVK